MTLHRGSMGYVNFTLRSLRLRWLKQLFIKIELGFVILDGWQPGYTPKKPSPHHSWVVKWYIDMEIENFSRCGGKQHILRLFFCFWSAWSQMQLVLTKKKGYGSGGWVVTLVMWRTVWSQTSCGRCSEVSLNRLVKPKLICWLSQVWMGETLLVKHKAL